MISTATAGSSDPADPPVVPTTTAGSSDPADPPVVPTTTAGSSDPADPPVVPTTTASTSDPADPPVVPTTTAGTIADSSSLRDWRQLPHAFIAGLCQHLDPELEHSASAYGLRSNSPLVLVCKDWYQLTNFKLLGPVTPYHAASASALAIWLQNHGESLEVAHLDFTKPFLDRHPARAALIQGLAGARGLRSLVLVNLNLSSPEDLTHLLRPLGQLTELGLRECQVPPEALTRLPHLQVVELYQPPYAKQEKIARYMELLADLSSNLQQLKHLTLAGATVPAAAFPILSKLPHLQHLSMPIIGDSDTLSQLRQHPSLVAALSALKLRVCGPAKLARSLEAARLFRVPNRITSLTLAHFRMSTPVSVIGPAVAYIAAATAGSEVPLRSLSLTCFKICRQTLVAIGKLTGLTDLQLKGCELLDDPYPSVESLSSLRHLRNLHIGDKYVGRMEASMFLHRGPLARVSGLGFMLLLQPVLHFLRFLAIL